MALKKLYLSPIKLKLCYLGPMSLLSSLCIVRVFCTAPFSLAMYVLSMIVESRYQRTLGGGSPKATIRINMKTLLILIISKHIKRVPEKIRSVKHGNLVDSYTFFGRTPCFPQHIYLLPPVATHWMVKGSPSLNGPTGREFDNCLPRSPRIRGVEGGTEIII